MPWRWRTIQKLSIHISHWRSLRSALALSSDGCWSWQFGPDRELRCVVLKKATEKAALALSRNRIKTDGGIV
jgi:hypothetical protein